ncbi:hypothetical protein AXF42_Ash002128 [Apostasia shenzhenica]|uniref:GrpE protein homolog n=1 Tax=Apostasia shenzhenica TaxID=1088818 RepID=A0A2I0AMX0_9ASPA|nr:hypothetical protein AXF42_Ash002128 [Apostasia shenzhenica]
MRQSAEGNEEIPSYLEELSGEEEKGGMQMAAAFSVHSLSNPPCASARSTSLKPLFAAPQPRLGSSRCSITAFKALYFQSCRTSLRATVKVAATDLKTINGNEENQATDNKSENVTGKNGSMKALTQAYRKAILSGDENDVCEIEASICILEKEKDELSLKLTELMSEFTSRKDKFLRLNADFENFRKRSEKERATFTSDIRSEVIERLLPVVDSFEHSKQQVKLETEKEKKIDASYQGIYKQFVEVLRSMRVSVVETVGRPFDPLLTAPTFSTICGLSLQQKNHEAVAREESQQFKSGIVTKELRRGFVLGDRVLRPAAVKVSTGFREASSSAMDASAMGQPGAAAEPLEDPAPASSNS